MPVYRVCLFAHFLMIIAYSSPARAETVFNVRDFGAVGDGVALDTEAVQKAFDECGDSGGGTVLVPEGTYLCKPLVIRTSTTLQLDKGATLKFTDDPSDYARTDKPGEFTHLFTGKDLENITIKGKGTIDGSGQKWWVDAEAARQKKSGYTLPRPNLIVFTRVKNLTVRDVTIQNAPKFHFVPTDCENVIVEDAKFFAPERAPNTDAIDPSMCRNVTIRRCLIDVGDDNVAVKSGDPHPDREFAADTLLVEDCTIKHGHGISFGSEIVGGVKDVVVRNCTFEGTDNGIRIKTDRKKGGPVTNILYENITMKDVAGAITITCYYPKIPAIEEPKPVTKTTPAYSNITIRNLTATSTKDAGFIVGLPESPIRNVLLENVKITSDRAGLEIRHVEGIKLENVEVLPAKGKPLIVNDAEIEQ